MKLLPALKIGKRIIVGDERDSHNTVGIKNNVLVPEEVRGFSPDGKLFMSRKQALGWLKRNEPRTYAKLPQDAHNVGLHSEHLAAARGIKQYPPAEEMRAESGRPEEDKKPNLGEKTVLVVDRGLHTYCAEKLAESFKKVYYYLSEENPYPNSAKASIGTGLKNIKRIGDMWDVVDDVDLICFFDTNYGDLAHYLRKHGYRVFGSGKGEHIELDKIGFLETLEKLGLNCAKTYLAEGIPDAMQYLEKHKNETLFLKCLRRGDFESKKFTSIPQITPFFDDVRKRLGTAADSVEILIQHKIDSEVEAGIDTMTVDGEYVPNAVIGIEGKDVCFVGQIFAENPPILQEINDAFAPVIKKLGYRGNYSTEVRITDKGENFFIDPTPRQPEPPGALMTELYANWAECLWHIAEGRVPTPRPAKKFGAQYILTSWWHNENELHVRIDPKYRGNLKLKNHKVVAGEIYCVPNENGEYWGSIVALGDSMDKAIDEIKKIADTIEADGFKFDPDCFKGIMESAEKAKKFGINFDM